MRRLILAPLIATLTVVLVAFTQPEFIDYTTFPAGRPAAWNEIMGAGDIAPAPGVDADNDVATSDLLLAANPPTVFTTGDNQYLNGDYSDFASRDGYDGSWGRLKSKTCATVGNHDYSNAAFGPTGFTAYFSKQCPHRPDTQYATYTGSDGKVHQIKTAYAFRPAPGSGWWGYVLDSQCDHSGEPGPSCARFGHMLNWFRSHMASHPAQCRIAFWHHPRFGSWKNQSDYKVYWLYAVAAANGRVSLIVNGHSHWYQRFTSLNPATGAIDGTYTAPRSFTVGTGGVNLIPFTIGPIAGERYRDDKHFGVLRITLGNGKWATEFDRTDGTVADKASASC